MKEILIPLNFTTTPVLYDSKQSFSASDESSGVLTFTTTANVTGTVASLTIRNASDNANRQTILVERLDINSSPFSYIIVKPLPFGSYEGEITLKKGTQIVASAVFLFGVNSSLSASVLPKLVEAYSLDALVEEVETEVSNLKDAYNLTVSETVKGVNKTESTLQLSENVRYLNEATRKANELLRISQENARVTEEGNRVIADALRETKEGVRQSTFEANEVIRDGVVDAAIEGEMIAQNVATKLTEKEATFAPRMLSLESELAEVENTKAEQSALLVSLQGQLTEVENTKAEQSALLVEKARIDSLNANFDAIGEMTTGTNANGTYTRWPNGFTIARKTITYNNPSGWTAGTQVVFNLGTLPIAFIGDYFTSVEASLYDGVGSFANFKLNISKVYPHAGTIFVEKGNAAAKNIILQAVIFGQS